MSEEKTAANAPQAPLGDYTAYVHVTRDGTRVLPPKVLSKLLPLDRCEAILAHTSPDLPMSVAVKLERQAALNARSWHLRPRK